MLKSKLMSKLKKHPSKFSKGLQFYSRVAAALISLGFVLVPLNAQAGNSTITKTNLGIIGTSVTSKGNVHNIYADLANENYAINHFKDFKLANNEIANLYFKTKATSTVEAATLVNFVDNRIDIAGTVNAIKNNQIGGNMYFVSANGMLVQGTGVINAGSLTLLTPTPSSYSNLVPGKLLANNGTIQKVGNKLNNKEYTINETGSIIVQGQINTTDNINLEAGSVEIGNSEWDAATKANLKTGVVNFTDIVNIKAADGTVMADAGLSGELVATKTANGDVVLAAAKELAVYSNASLQAEGNMDITAKDVSIFTEVKAVQSAEISAAGELYNAGTLSVGEDAALTAQNLINDGIIATENGNITLAATNELVNAGELFANKGSIALASAQLLQNYGFVTAAKDVTLHATTEVANYGPITSGMNVSISSDNGDIVNEGFISSELDTSLQADKGSIKLSEGITAGQKLTIRSGGSVSVYAGTNGSVSLMLLADFEEVATAPQMEPSVLLRSANDSVEIAAQQDIKLDKIDAKKDVALKSEHGAIVVKDIDVEGTVDILAKENISVNMVEAKKAVALNSNNGAIAVVKLKADTLDIKTSTGEVKVEALEVSQGKITSGEQELKISAGQGALNYNAVSEIVSDILAGIKGEDTPPSGADEPHNGTEIIDDIRKQQLVDIENARRDAERASMQNENGENKAEEQGKYVLYNRFHLYDLPKENEVVQSADGTIIISENAALTNAVEEKKEDKKK